MKADSILFFPAVAWSHWYSSDTSGLILPACIRVEWSGRWLYFVQGAKRKLNIGRKANTKSIGDRTV